MKRFRSLAVFITLAALLVTFLLPADADAQRRRRRRRPAPEPQAEPAEEEQEEAPAEEDEEAPAEMEAPPPVEPEPTPSEPEPAPAEPEADALPDLGPLRAELATLMDELVQTRARVAVLGRQLFETKVRVRIENRADDSVLSALTLRLDGAPVFVMEGRIGEDGDQVFEGFAAPGPHDLSVEAEQRSRANGDYRFTQNDRYRFEVLQGKLTEIVIVLDEDSDIGEDFEDDGEGEYDVRTRVRVATRELTEGS